MFWLLEIVLLTATITGLFLTLRDIKRYGRIIVETHKAIDRIEACAESHGAPAEESK